MALLLEVIVVSIFFALGILFYLKIRKRHTNNRPTPTPRSTDVAEYYLKAAEEGDVDAQYNLANMYRAGYGVPQDYAEALKWYKTAAGKGHIYAQFNLGQIYEKGCIDRQDILEAAKWYCRSARQSSKQARYALQHLLREVSAGRKFLTENH
jgi:hypothetical protein